MFRLYVCVPHVCMVPNEARRGHQILWDSSLDGYDHPCGPNLEFKPGFSVTAASAHKCWTISPDPNCKLLYKNLSCVRLPYYVLLVRKIPMPPNFCWLLTRLEKFFLLASLLVPEDAMQATWGELSLTVLTDLWTCIQ